MKKSKAEKTLDNEMVTFGRQMAMLALEEHFATSQFWEARLRLIENRQKAKAHPDPELRRILLKDGIIGSSAVGTDVTGKLPIHFPIGLEFIRTCEMEAALLDNLDRQYCWLLVSAYEEYERLLKNLYACMGFLDRAFWKCDDYGDISPDEIARKDLPWFKDRIRNRSNVKFRHDAFYALRQFRQAFPGLQSYETRALVAGRTSLYCDAIIQRTIDTLPLGMTCQLAGNLRHAIVHDQGSVDSIESLQAAVGAQGVEKERVVASHVKGSPEGVHIWIVYDADGMLDGKFLSLRIQHLLESLNAHACLVYKSCAGHFGHKPFWERQDSKVKRGRKNNRRKSSE